MESWIIDVTGNDVDRAKAIIRTKTNLYNIRFVVRELPDRRSESAKASDKKCVVLWTKNGWVDRPARFEIAALKRSQIESDSLSDEEDVESI